MRLWDYFRIFRVLENGNFLRTFYHYLVKDLYPNPSSYYWDIARKSSLVRYMLHMSSKFLDSPFKLSVSDYMCTNVVSKYFPWLTIVLLALLVSSSEKFNKCEDGIHLINKSNFVFDTDSLSIYMYITTCTTTWSRPTCILGGDLFLWCITISITIKNKNMWMGLVIMLWCYNYLSWK